MCTKDVLRDIFAGNKHVLKLVDVNFIQVVKYDELSVKSLYDKLIKLPSMSSFFPDKYPKGKVCDREYLFNIANTLHPAVMKELIEYALSQRHNIAGQEMQQEAVLATDHWASELRSMPFFAKVSLIMSAEILFRSEARCQPS